ncbi:MAG: hypothetical protein ABUL72_06110, partial [Armatimonadota bacterium]
MRAFVWLGALSVLASALASPPAPGRVSLIVTGNYQGQLSPCGCTRPMSGGIKRLATLVARAKGAVLVDSGGWVVGSDRQDVMKAETIAETLGGLKVSAALLTPQEQALGDATVENLTSLMGEPWLTSGKPVENSGLWIGGDGLASPEVESASMKEWLANRPRGQAA